VKECEKLRSQINLGADSTNRQFELERQLKVKDEEIKGLKTEIKLLSKSVKRDDYFEAPEQVEERLSGKINEL
jgi:hypothetical protein